MDSFPGLVIHLAVEQGCQAVGPAFIQGMSQFFSAHDPEHVESAQGIEGHQAAGLRRRRALAFNGRGSISHGEYSRVYQPCWTSKGGFKATKQLPALALRLGEIRPK